VVCHYRLRHGFRPLRDESTAKEYATGNTGEENKDKTKENTNKQKPKTQENITKDTFVCHGKQTQTENENKHKERKY